MKYRQTFVIEYDSPTPPRFGREPALGGTIVAMQFNDALMELEMVREACRGDVLREIDARLQAMDAL